jgi:hypothetical protein
MCPLPPVPTQSSEEAGAGEGEIGSSSPVEKREKEKEGGKKKIRRVLSRLLLGREKRPDEGKQKP